MWVSDVGVWVYVYVCEKGRTKKGPGEVLRVLLWAIAPLLTSEVFAEHKVEVRNSLW